MHIVRFLSTVFAALALVLSCWLYGSHRGQISWQDTLESRQDELNLQQQEMQKQREQIEAQQNQVNIASQLAKQTGPELLKDLATLAANNSAIEELLKKHGLTLDKSAPAPAAP